MSDPTGLTIQETQKLVDDLTKAGAAGYTRIDDIYFFPLSIARQLLATMQRGAKLREALEDLISCAEAFATVRKSGELMHDCERARKALARCEYP